MVAFVIAVFVLAIIGDIATNKPSGNMYSGKARNGRGGAQ